ncbi:NADPH-dependent diflavin oxidoreductase 1-like [Ptiloglossa arizonensis]|uniref:NADPH-dependent diflavin oxidoreductase 1-like n=1 Tax=Ptiloglossa arizonensis TaxID=3350558 RepID=UPI003FA0BF89
MNNTNITILYGSETGTAQDVAEQIWKDAKRTCLHSTVYAMNDYEIQNLDNEKIVIFVVATTGQGDPPSNMRQFWRLLLRKSLPSTLLANIKYGILGLGDSSYQKFNFAAKKLNKRLIQLGAKELLPIGLADDQHDLGIDAIVDPWLKELWTKISDVFNISIRDLNSNRDQIIERFSVSEISINSVNNTYCTDNDIYMKEVRTNNEMRIGTLIENIRTTTQDHFQDVRLIKLKSNNINYQPGDIVYVRPKNSKKQIENFFSVLNTNNVQLNPNMKIQVSEKEIKVPIVLKQTLTLQQIVEQYWDLNFKPRRSTMQVLYFISEHKLEKEKLHEFATSSDQEELYNYINRPRRNILELLADFPHTTSRLNIKLLFEIMSPIKPRAFSIASSLRVTENEIHMLVAIVKYKTKLLEPRYGLCSNWLATLTKGDKVLFSIQKGTFKFEYNKPMILIGPGTGVAPFRSLLLDKSSLHNDLKNCVLFFGCRNKEKDNHCKNDFEYLSQKMHLNLFCAFSRDQKHKIYVQHVIHDQKQLCWNFLSRNGNIYLAGNSKNMPNCVREEFISLVKEIAELTEEEAESFIKHLEIENRYQVETWS